MSFNTNYTGVQGEVVLHVTGVGPAMINRIGVTVAERIRYTGIRLRDQVTVGWELSEANESDGTITLTNLLLTETGQAMRIALSTVISVTEGAMGNITVILPSRLAQ